MLRIILFFLLFSSPVFATTFSDVSLSPSALITPLPGTTAGTISYSQAIRSNGYKVFNAYLSGYENATATPQTIPFPTAFTNAPWLCYNGTGLTITATTTGITLPASMGATATGGYQLCGF